MAVGQGHLGAAVLGGLLDSHRRPRPPYDAGPEAAVIGATSMIDISDGLAADLGHVAEASGVLIDIDAAALPGDPAPPAAAGVLGVDWRGWGVAGGQGHATGPPVAAGGPPPCPR